MSKLFTKLVTVYKYMLAYQLIKCNNFRSYTRIRCEIKKASRGKSGVATTLWAGRCFEGVKKTDVLYWICDQWWICVGGWPPIPKCFVQTVANISRIICNRLQLICKILAVLWTLILGIGGQLHRHIVNHW